MLENAKPSPAVASALTDLRTLHEKSQEQHSKSQAVVRLIEWSWVLDFEPLEACSQRVLRDPGVTDSALTMTGKNSVSTRLANDSFNLMRHPLSMPRTYETHGFAQLGLPDSTGYHSVLATLFSDCFIFAQPLDRKDTTEQSCAHRSNWIAHTVIFKTQLVDADDAIMLYRNSGGTPRIQIKLSTLPFSMAIENGPYAKENVCHIYCADEDALNSWAAHLECWRRPGSVPTVPLSRDVAQMYIPSAMSKRATCHSPVSETRMSMIRANAVAEARMTNVRRNIRDSQATVVPHHYSVMQSTRQSTAIEKPSNEPGIVEDLASSKDQD